MKLVRRNLLAVKRKYLGGLLLLAFISMIYVAYSMTGTDDFDFARREILLRRIGHEVLLQSGDSVSRVLPVKKTAEDEYQISFEKAFTFQPESLVRTTSRLLTADPLASDYVVNVLNCSDRSVAYGFAISRHQKDDIIACLGRKQSKACYLISVKFQPQKTNTPWYLLGCLAFLAAIGYVFLGRAKLRTDVPEKPATIPDDQDTGLPTPPNGMFALGSMSFDAAARRLITNEKTIDLTKTEARVLRIFASSPNEVIERSRLQKEIWEDEGVIVGRSLDMFISKLRKKLEVNPTIKIAVVRGKGYKLEINPQDSSGS